jgi:DNA-binding transcriptional ArsR family regulator
MEHVYELQANVLRMLAHPRRLEMLHVLASGPIEVGSLAAKLGISQPNASQHLALLRSAGLVQLERKGREVRYELSDPAVITACDIMRGFLERRFRRLSTVAVTAGGTHE